MKRFLLPFVMLLSLSASAQFDNYNNLELSIGYKPLLVNTNTFSYRFVRVDTIDTNTNVVTSTFDLAPPQPPIILQGGLSIHVKDNFLAVLRAWRMLNTTETTTWGFSIGAAYRWKINYFIRLQPELRFFYGQSSLPMGPVNYTGRQLNFDDIQFVEGTPVEGIYRNRNFSMVPAAKFIVDIKRRWEFRFSAAYHIGLVNSQGVILQSSVVPGQPISRFVSLKEETAEILQDGKAPDKPLIRFSRTSVKVGIGWKFML